MESQVAVFLVETQEIKCSCSDLIANSQYFYDALRTFPDAMEYRISLPRWITPTPLRYLLDYFRSGLVEFVDILDAQKTLWIADFFKCADFRNKLISRVIIPQLTPQNVLHFLPEAFQKSTELKGSWTTLSEACLSLVSDNAPVLFQEYPQAVDNFPLEMIERIVRGYLATNVGNSEKDCSALFPVWIKSNPASNILVLLNKEQTHITQETNWRANATVLSTFPAIPFTDDETTFQSPDLTFCGCRWTVKIAVSAVAGTLQVLLQYLSPDGSDWKHKIVSMSLAAEINGKMRSFQKLLTVPTDRSAGECFHIEEIDLEQDQKESQYSVVFLGREEPVVAQLLTFIARNPDSFTSESISCLSPSDFMSLLQYKFFLTPSEDAVLDMVGRWTEARFTCSKDADRDLKQLLPCIRREFLSVTGLVLVCTQYHKLKLSPEFQTWFRQELEVRMSGKKVGLMSKRDIDEKPRHSYKKAAQRRNPLSHRECVEELCASLFKSVPKRLSVKFTT